MEPIELAEKVACETLKEVRSAYDALHDRAYKFVTLIVGAAGALAAYALGRIGGDTWIWQALPLGVLSFWLFAVAGALLVRGTSTKSMMAGATAASVRKTLIKNTPKASLPDEGKSEAKSSTDLADRLAQSVGDTRWSLTASIDVQIELYSAGTKDRASALDRAYLLAVLGSPLAIAIGLWIAWRHS